MAIAITRGVMLGMFPPSMDYSMQFWLVSTDNGVTIVRGTISDKDDHVLFAALGEGCDVESAQNNCYGVLSELAGA